MECKYLSSDLVEEAASGSADWSLGSKLEVLRVHQNSQRESNQSMQPSVHLIAQNEGCEQRAIQHHHYTLLTICCLSLPPTIIDRSHWRDMINHLDPKMECVSSSHMSTPLIPAEAAHICQLLIKTLQKHQHLTLSFDGATTRQNQSIYTVHVTSPVTWEAHLLNGDEATGKSHTGEHLLVVLLKV
jgi:hypothetical protein